MTGRSTKLGEIAGSLEKGLEYEKAGDLESAYSEYSRASSMLFRIASQETGQRKLELVTRAETALEKAQALKSTMSRSAGPEGSGYRYEETDNLQIRFAADPEMKDVTFKDIAGQENVKKIIRTRIIDAARNPELAIKFRVNGGNFLLYGPPGTGKTLIVHAIANEIGYKLFRIEPSKLMEAKFGQFEKNIRSLFEGVLSAGKCIMFFDEFDSLAPSRSRTNSSYMKRAVPEFLTNLDMLNEKGRGSIIVIAATNEPWSIDPAIMRAERFDDIIYVPLPDKDARVQMFRKYLGDKPVSPELSYSTLAELSEGLTGAEIKNVCRRAGEAVFGDIMSGSDERPIEEGDVSGILKSYKGVVDEKMLEKFENFSRSSFIRF